MSLAVPGTEAKGAPGGGLGARSSSRKAKRMATKRGLGRMATSKAFGVNSANFLGWTEMPEKVDDKTAEQKEEETRNDRIFAKTMWDNTEAVFTKYKQNQQAGHFVQAFMERLQKVEAHYAAELEKAVNQTSAVPSKEFAEQPSLCSAFNALKTLTSVRAQAAKQVATLLKRAVATRKVLNADTMMKAPSVAQEKKVAQTEKAWQAKQQKMMDKKAKKQKFQQKHSGLVGSASDEEFLQAAKLSDKKKKKYSEIEMKVKEAEIAGHMTRQVYNETVSTAMDTMQRVEFERVDLLHRTLAGIAELYNKSAGLLWKSSLKAKAVVARVDKASDLNSWAKQWASGESCPWIHDREDDRKQSMRKAQYSANPFSRTAMIKSTVRSSTRVGDLQGEAKEAQSKFEQIRRKKEEQARKRREDEQRAQRLEEQKDEQEKQMAAVKAQILKVQQQKLKAQQEAATEAKHQAELDEARQAERKKAEAEREALLAKLMEEKAQAEEQKSQLLKALEEERQRMEEQKKALEEARAKAEAEAKRAAEFALVDKTKSSEEAARAAKQASRIEAGGTAYMDELLTPVVIDNGSAFIKAGFSGQERPALVVPSVVTGYPHPKAPFDADMKDEKCLSFGAEGQHLLAYSNDQLRVDTEVFSDNPTNWDDLELMWSYIFDRMGVDPTAHPILITQPCMPPLQLKEKLSEVFFETFQVPALYVATAPLMSAYAYGSSSGLVVDVGHSSAQVVPVVDGYLLSQRVKRVTHLGGASDTQRLVEFLQYHGVQQPGGDSGSEEEDFDLSRFSPSTYVMATNIKNRLARCLPSSDEFMNVLDVLETVQGFVGGGGGGDDDDDEEDGGGDDDGDDDGFADADETATSLPLALQVELLKTGEVLFKPREVLGDSDTSIVSVTEMVAGVVKACDVDTRRVLMENIFLSGGVTTMPGFKLRLENELKDLFPHASHLVHVHDEQNRYASWLGGSVLSSLDDFHDSWVFAHDWEDAHS